MQKEITPTDKQRKFVDGLIEGKSKYQAAIDANYSPNTAKNATKDILEKPGTQVVVKSLAEVFEAMGITDELIAQKAIEGLEAERQSITGDWYKDYATRHKYLDTIIKVKGGITEKVDHTSKGEAIQPLLVKFIGDDSGTNTDDITGGIQTTA